VSLFVAKCVSLFVAYSGFHRRESKKSAMPTVYVLGAGASHGYDQSPTGVRPPLAAGLFEAYGSLEISGDLLVKVGWIVNYVRDRFDVPVEKFATFRLDAEEFMTGVEDEVREFLDRFAHKRDELPPDEILRGFEATAAYDQTLFLFTHILNEIGNGPTSNLYTQLVHRFDVDDTIITFNWDTLLDRALNESSTWQCDDGYHVRFSSIFDDGWRLPERPRKNIPMLLKLHGSTNWLTRYVSWDMRSGRRAMHVSDPKTVILSFSVATDRSVDDVLERGYPLYKPSMRQTHGKVVPIEHGMLRPLCFVRGTRPFPTFDARFRAGYEPFTYFYSPLDPNDEVPTSPLIVAPVKNKAYDDFAEVLEPIWDEAARRIAEASHIRVIGFSFPRTDVRARRLFTPVGHKRTVEVIDPHPQRAASVLRELTGTDVAVTCSTLSELVRS